ncbi:MAG: tetratricopeptide repeat protein, partial [Prochlorococcaceae cyanobacterium]
DGRIAERFEMLQHAIIIDPGYAQAHLNLGVAYQERGDLFDAMACYKEALRLEPDLPEGYCNLGLALQLSGDYEEAHVAFERAISLRSDYLDALSNLAQLKVAMGDDSAAVEVYRLCVALAPECVRNRFALGGALHRCNFIEQALEAYEHCLLLEPQRSDILIELCSGLRQLGRADEAIVRLLPFLAIEPGNIEALFMYAVALHALGSVDQAVEILEQALRVDQNDIDCLIHLGRYLQDLGRIDEAVVSLEKALLVKPGHPAVLGNLAIAYRFQGRYDSALSLFQEAIAANPKRRDLYHGLLFHYSIGSEVFAPAMLEAARSYWKLVQEQVPLSRPPISLGSPPRKIDCDKRKIRIGILSAELGDHVVSNFVSPLLEHYDRHLFEVEVISVSRMYHERAKLLASLADHSYSLQGLNVSEARLKLQGCNYDIILETSGFTRSSGIEFLAERCAPVQAHYIGYHATTGLDTMDFFIGDEETVPDSFAVQFSERLWRLPRPWLACSPLEDYPPAVSESTKNIPVLGSFNQLSKVREETLSFWAAVMQKLPTSVLILKDKTVSSSYVCERIKATLESYCIDPKRVFFLDLTPTLQSHLLHYNIIDVALDATPWSSATTAFDALAMGVPLVAIRGECTSARMSSSLLKGLGKVEWIASTPDQYADIVADLCFDLSALRKARAQRQKDALGSVLFDGKDMVAALQEAFFAMVAHAR